MTTGSRTGALAGLQVVDLSRVLGGPYCTQILGDHGAEVLKIEPPSGDETRAWGPPFVAGSTAYFRGVNRNKRSLVLDLATEQGRDLLLGFLEGADVLVENYKPGTLERWGLGPEVLAERFPKLVHCRVSGYGSTGPLGGMPGYDAAIQAMAGLMSVNGEPDGEPTRLGIPVVDLVTGLNAAIGILLALQERQVSGRGQFVETALYDCGLSILHPHLPNLFASGKTPGRTGNAHPNIAPYSSFPTGRGAIFLAVGNDGQFRRMCTFLGRPDLPDEPRFKDNAARLNNRAELEAILRDLLAAHDATVLAESLIKLGVPCGPVLTVAEAVAHPQTAAREMIVEMGGYKGVASPIKLSRTPATYRRPPPALNDFGSENGTPASTTEER
ncbi:MULTISPECIES: CaiB/BaiF CoA transferase family protein [unclassified Methylobacterium]|jgi:formyl-CoA transferase|uniref:CaiB/BaiF CoA transferase family protein n=1 Tax=unclassified Methylobacterium TaxID=2615210 RepID=UPI001355D990|nr:CoA transferase [Methylobacterium sp. 2A]MWV22354.1 CoA transferase [Methylobacterium sp. 2A]